MNEVCRSGIASPILTKHTMKSSNSEFDQYIFCVNSMRMKINLDPFPIYFSILFRPMTLDMIRNKVDPNSPSRYTDVESFISDVRLMFSNAYLFYRVSNCVSAQISPREKKYVLIKLWVFILQEDSKIYSNARYLERFFEEQLIKWLPYCASKHSSGTNTTRFESTATKRPRYNDDLPMLIGDDDDVILA